MAERLRAEGLTLEIESTGGRARSGAATRAAVSNNAIVEVAARMAIADIVRCGGLENMTGLASEFRVG